jgi:hypothetical protein
MKREQRQQEKALAKRHKAELREMTRQEKALTALDKRERRSLETAIKRDDFQHLTREIKTREARIAPAGQKPPQRAPEREPFPQMPAEARRSRLQDFFAGKTTPAREAQDAPISDEAERQAERDRQEQERLRKLQQTPRLDR